MTEDQEQLVACRICGEEVLGAKPESCDGCGEDIEAFCPACALVAHTLEFQSWALHDTPLKFWQGLADYAIKQRDLAIHYPEETIED